MANNRKKVEKKSSASRVDKSTTDTCLFAMLCIVVGLPVEVQVKDGSVYSGVFHAADVASGVVLKKAKKITEGKRVSNVPLGSFVDSLVILSEDFVQIIVKDFALPSEKSVKSLEKVENVSAPVENESSKNTIKQSKLNASARSFSPFIAKPRLVSSPAVASSPVISPSPVQNQFFVPPSIIKTIGSPPVGPHVGTYSVVPNRPFITEKPMLYSNFVAANGGMPNHFPQPIMGCENMRLQPVGVLNQYRPVHVAPNYYTPSPSNVFAPRPSPVMCVHPISQGAIQGPALISNPILNPYQTTLHKLQGPPPICGTPQLIVNPNRPLIVPNPVQFVQNFGPFRPMIIPNGPGFYPTNFT